MGKRAIRFKSTHGIVEAKPYDCVSITFGMSKEHIPHTPIMEGGVCKSLTTMCDHDIGVVVDE